jgi:Flp pilus assembly protein TadG
VFFILLSLIIVFVSAFIYESAQQSVTQTVKEIANITWKAPALGDIKEGETKTYTKADVIELGEAISIMTTEPNVYLHLDSNISSLSTYYTTYTITVKFITVQGVSHSVGETACTMNITSPDPAAITLDAAGSWAFDFEVTTTAKSVSADQDTTATIVVTAEST